jgi:TRAP-type uncharacterized transport system substrate-binding protein
MMKALYDHSKEKDAIHPQARQWSLENMFRGAGYTTKYIPFHPGAIKYLKEQKHLKTKEWIRPLSELPKDVKKYT